MFKFRSSLKTIHTINLYNVGHIPNVEQHYFCNGEISFQDLCTYYIPLERQKYHTLQLRRLYKNSCRWRQNRIVVSIRKMKNIMNIFIKLWFLQNFMNILWSSYFQYTNPTLWNFFVKIFIVFFFNILFTKFKKNIKKSIKSKMVMTSELLQYLSEKQNKKKTLAKEHWQRRLIVYKKRIYVILFY